ncbi:hypothetical protein E2C01_052956 [Portunus trituberculatus]|uniref:Uncharacterized protein n=1 Tax=Portunus trituberculatus TaxID=210409 RepID=A0A5B7GN26_PORTR|nr:hypothetical protein [Portunus trituberculatus]
MRQGKTKPTTTCSTSRSSILSWYKEGSVSYWGGSQEWCYFEGDQSRVDVGELKTRIAKF